MDKLDYRILQALQNDFPLGETPYEILASRLQIPCQQLWDRIGRLMAEGVIRRIGASLDSSKFGFYSTLAAVSVELTNVERAAEIIGWFHEVTHSYLRSDHFNIWFTIIAADEKKIGRILEQIRCSLALKGSQVLNLPVRRMFKLDARFDVLP